MQIFEPVNWEDYELIDTGGLEKLERFGKYILTRPEPQAVWEKALPEKEWERSSHAIYRRTRGIDPSSPDYTEKGEWKCKPGMPEQWFVSYSWKEMKLKFRLGLTSFGHIGIFPEQAVNWVYIYDFVKSAVRHSPIAVRRSQFANDIKDQTTTGEKRKASSEQREFRLLNLFAYTGGASLAAKAAGADVVHVDSVKPVINWAKEDMELSGLRDIRWVLEDALKFARREVKRGNRYDGIILDPPAYGRGPEGEKWVLQNSVNEMVGLCSDLLSEKGSVFIMSLYSMGFSPLIAENLVKNHFKGIGEIESGEICFRDRALRRLPLGTLLRFNKQV